MRFDGIRLATAEDLVQRADVCFMAATGIEFSTIVGVLKYSERLPIEDPDLREVVVGFRADTICVVGQAIAKRAIRAYPRPQKLLLSYNQVSTS